MIQAITKTNFFTYICTEDNKQDLNAGKFHTSYLFKFTNDMKLNGGALNSVEYFYPFVIKRNPRFNLFSFNYSATPDMYQSGINLLPAGYWKYEIYEVCWEGDMIVSSSTAPATETDVLPVDPLNGVVKGLVTKGKLYLAEKDGEQEVQYQQYQEPASNAYIYTG